MKIGYYTGDYKGLTELFGLPAVGKTTFLNQHGKYINVNETTNNRPGKRLITKISSLFYILFFQFSYFKNALFFVIKSRPGLKDGLRLFLNLVRIKKESLLFDEENIVSDQGFFQASWAIAVFSSLENELMCNLLIEFINQNHETFPKRVIVMNDDFEDILKRDIKRYGKYGDYYNGILRQSRAKYFFEVVKEIIHNDYSIDE